MICRRTPPGPPESKREEDPISALNEFYHKNGGGKKPVYAPGYSPGGGITCTLRLPDLPGSIQAAGKNRKEAKRAVAAMACKSVLA